jgi:NTF2 fold immunity protein
MTTAMCCRSIAFAQTPTPTSTLRPREVPKWVSDYQVPLPKEGLVPDKETAIKIAEVILFRLYGEEDIIAERPYKVKQEDDIWWISGTLKENGFGSAFNIAISKQTGAVLHLEH